MGGRLCGKFKDHHELPPQMEVAMAAKYDDRSNSKYRPKDFDKLPKKEKPLTSGAILGKILKYSEMKGDKLPRTMWAPFVQLVEVELKAQDAGFGAGAGGPKVISTLQEAVIVKDTPLLSGMIDALHGFTQLFSIELVNCELQEMPHSLFEVDNLRVLRLSCNHITVLRDDLGRSGSPSYLHTLQMDANRLTTIMPNIFFGKLHQLEQLNLSQNRIVLLPEDFVSGCKKLRLLDLSNNYLSHLPVSICENGESLEILMLNTNTLADLPKQMYLLRKLRKLFVSSNNLGRFPDRLGECSQLEKLRAAKNKIREWPDSFVNLWSARGGRLEELLLEGNPLVKPSITALENGGLESAMRLFSELVEKKNSKGVDEAAPAASVHEMLAKDDDELRSARSGSVASGRRMSLGLSSIADSTDALISPNLGRRMSHQGDQDALSRQMTPASEATALQQEKYMWYFADYSDEQIKQIRNSESTMLMVKKQLYVENRVMRATEAANLLRSKEDALPASLAKLLDHDFDAGKYTGKVRTTPIDVGFALLVFSTKPLAPNCKNFFQQFDAEGRGYLTHDQWMAFGGKVPVKLTDEFKDDLWRLMASSHVNGKGETEQVLQELDFAAGWHLHDVEAKCPWISRVARVLKMEYYSMTLEELQRKVEMSGTAQFQPHLLGSGDSSDEEQFIKEQVEHVVAVIPPRLEGERRLEKRGEDQSATVAKGNTPMQGKMISMSQQEYVLYGGTRADSSSSSEEGEPGDGLQALLDDDELSLSDSSWHSLEAMDWITDPAEAPEEEDTPGPLQTALPQGAQDLQHLMMLPFVGLQGLMRRPAVEERGSAEVLQAAPVASKKGKEGRKRRTVRSGKDERFKTDVFNVRIGLRQARRNLPEADFKKLVNFLLRGMKLIKHYTHKPTYWHVSDPSFRHATGIANTTFHVRELLVEMGFVCISEKYWCWPAKHLRFPGSASSDWGKKLVPTQCPGLLPDRLDDMVKLFRMVQRDMVQNHAVQSG
mmetsp:Transcript_1873/g.4752  ORF Transcript_1873/g.4752 Transcript_1873/m.4752 type:complete len:1000 (-) Transcript_1873:43-3042(-)